MKKLVLSVICIFSINIFYAQQEPQEQIEIDEEEIYNKYRDSIEQSFTYSYGKIDLDNGMATINVPQGYKFLDGNQSKKVLEDLWGNPPSNETLGLLFPEDITPLSDNFSYAVEIEYLEEGYIDDDDAKDLNYDDLLKEMQNDTKLANGERIKQGYVTVELIGWAAEPFYDSQNHKLHWAKEIKFGDDEINTLNYNIRVLGRKGFLNLNAIGDMNVLPKVQNDVNNILASVEFNEGHRYSDFNPDLDKVAAYGIGGLIAGKVLAKAGAFAFLLKFWKIIAIGAVAMLGGFRKRFFGRKS
jgi:uncharacterized membrane-anchored protein